MSTQKKQYCKTWSKNKPFPEGSSCKGEEFSDQNDQYWQPQFSAICHASVSEMKVEKFFRQKNTALFLISVIILVSLESASQVDVYMPKPKENPIER